MSLAAREFPRCAQCRRRTVGRCKRHQYAAADLSKVRTVPLRSRMLGGAGALTAEYAEDRAWISEKYRTVGGNPYHPIVLADFLRPLLDAGYHL